MFFAYQGMVCSVFIMFLGSSSLYKGSLIERIFLTLLLYAIFFSGENAAYGLFTLLKLDHNIAYYHELLIVLSVLSRFFNLFFITGFYLLFQRYALYNIQAEKELFVLIILFPIPILICFVTLKYSPYARGTVSMLFWFCLISLMLATGYLLILVIRVLENRQLKTYQETSSKLYDCISIELDNMAEKIHDFRHHINAVKVQQNEDYINELEQQMPSRRSDTGNLLIDQLIAEEKERYPDIHFEITGKLPNVLSGVKATHLVSLFSNMLENAIHAVNILDGDKTIRLYTNFDGYTLFFQMENNYYEQQVTSGQGLGIKNMKTIANYYDGKLEIHKNKTLFLVKVLLQTKEGER